MGYKVTVLICTRDRGDSILATIRSIQANTYADFDLLIVDQSTNSQTARAIGSLEHDSRLYYIHTGTQGLSTARNIGLAFSRADLVLMTDDDCEVPPNWVAEMSATLLQQPQVGLVFCDVTPGPHDPQAGFIPISLSRHTLLIEDLAHWQTCDGVNLGIGAGMAVRRAAAASIGGFDPLFGAGTSFFYSAEDLDFTLRLLAAGYQVSRINNVSVLHHGFRTLEQGRTLMRISMFSIAVAYGRMIRLGQWPAIRAYATLFVSMVLAPILPSLLRLRVPPVLGRTIWLIRGIIEGLRLRPAPPTRSFW